MFNPETVKKYFQPSRGQGDPGGVFVAWHDYKELWDRLNQFLIAKPLSEWHEDLGPCLWWIFPICEPPYSGTPMDCDWPDYHTHFTRLTNEMCPRPENGQKDSDELD